MKNIKLYVLLAVLLVTGLAGVVLLNKPSALPRQTVNTQAQLLSIGIDGNVGTGSNGNIYFSNGRYLVEYDPGTGNTTALSNDGILPSISRVLVSPKDGTIAFQSPSTSFKDDLNPQVELAGYNPNEPQWWVLTPGKELILLPQGTKDAAWDKSGQLHTLTSKKVVVFDSRGSRKDTIKFESGQSIEVTEHSYLIQKNDGSLVEISLKGDKKTELEPKLDGVYVSPFKGNYVTYRLEGEIFKGYVHASNEAYVLGEFKEFALGWDASGDLLTYSDEQGLHTYDTRRNIINDYKITNKKIEHVRELFTLGLGSTIMRLENDDLYITGSSLSPTRATENSLFRLGPLEIQSFANKNQFNVSKEGVFSSADKAAVYLEIKNRGYNPDLMRIYFEEIALPEHPL